MGQQTDTPPKTLAAALALVPTGNAHPCKTCAFPDALRRDVEAALSAERPETPARMAKALRIMGFPIDPKSLTRHMLNCYGKTHKAR